MQEFFYTNRLRLNNSIKKIIYTNLTLLIPFNTIVVKSHNIFNNNKKLKRYLQKKSHKLRLPFQKKHSLMLLLCMWTALVYKSSNLVCQYLSLIFKLYIKRCFRFLNGLKSVFNLFFKKCNLKGIKVQFKGCLNNRRRSRSFDILKGSVPVQTISSQISYSQIDCLSIYGVCGIKVWIHY